MLWCNNIASIPQESLMVWKFTGFHYQMNVPSTKFCTASCGILNRLLLMILIMSCPQFPIFGQERLTIQTPNKLNKAELALNRQLKQSHEHIYLMCYIRNANNELTYIKFYGRHSMKIGRAKNIYWNSVSDCLVAGNIVELGEYDDSSLSRPLYALLMSAYYSSSFMSGQPVKGKKWWICIDDFSGVVSSGPIFPYGNCKRLIDIVDKVCKTVDGNDNDCAASLISEILDLTFHFRQFYYPLIDSSFDRRNGTIVVDYHTYHLPNDF